ncbi:hypothetical protein U1Q18_018252, partial [Sarracenia purpurea var. burkii]
LMLPNGLYTLDAIAAAAVHDTLVVTFAIAVSSCCHGENASDLAVLPYVAAKVRRSLVMEE